MPTIKERMDFVRETTGAPSKADFARWLNVKNPQTLSQAVTRGRLSQDLAILVSEVTGASVSWLLTSKGEPFPDGPTPYPGSALPSTAEARLRVAEDQIDAISTVMTACLHILSAKLPDVGPALAHTLATLSSPADPLPKRELLEAAVRAAALGLQSVAQDARPVVPAGLRGKPQQKNR